MHTTIKNIEQIPAFAGSSGADNAARLLASPEAHIGLTIEEARIVIRYMKPQFFPAKSVFIREGDPNNGFMALLVDGEVVVERLTTNRDEAVTIKVLGPGSLTGEMGLVDGEPRSASCVASTDIWCAILTRQAVESMISRDPMVAARLLLGISANIAERLRDTNRQLKLFARLAGTMREELLHNSVAPDGF